MVYINKFMNKIYKRSESINMNLHKCGFAFVRKGGNLTKKRTVAEDSQNTFLYLLRRMGVSLKQIPMLKKQLQTSSLTR